MKRIKADYLFLTILTPYPATPLFTDLKNREIIDDNIDWKYYSTESPFGLLIKNVSKEIFWQKFEKMSRLVDKTNYTGFKHKVFFEKRFAVFNYWPFTCIYFNRNNFWYFGITE